ncbi:MAG: 50S ribosomal protein L13 [Thermoplasmata archaeon]|nr:50S ribosomal protein L13 [Thermoplasmata archaeon]
MSTPAPAVPGGAAPPAPKAAPAAKPATSKPASKKATPATPTAATSSKPPRPEPGSEFPPTATIIDASGLVLGRAASLIAQRLLHGEVIVVVNAEKSVVTGNRQMVVREYTAARAQGSVRSGPHFPRYPDRIFRRTVRGMLPHLKTRGKVAYSHLHVFIGTPPGLTGRTHVPLPGAQARPALRPPTTLADITRLLGARV